MQDVNAGRGPPGNAGEGRRDRPVAVCGGRPAEHAVFALRSRMAGELPGRPRHAVGPDRPFKTVVRNVGIGVRRRAPKLQPGGRFSALFVPAPAVEQHEPRVVECANLFQSVHRMPEDGAVRRFVQKPPHHDTRVVSVAQNHAEHGFVVTLGHVRRVLETPRGVGFLVDHQPDLVAEVELVAFRNARDKTNRVEAHRFDIQQVAPQEIRIGGEAVSRWGSDCPCASSAGRGAAR